MMNTLLFAVAVVASRAADVYEHESCSNDMKKRITSLLEEAEQWTLEDAAHVAQLLEAHLRDLNRIYKQ